MIAIFCSFNALFQPVYDTYNNYDTEHGFYKEPKDTIEVLFVGTSLTVTGVIPIELYEEYGICAYNIATEQQSIVASYYWLKEVYESHSETLKTVVIDPTMLIHSSNEYLMQKSLDGMRFSANKVNAWKDFGAGEDLIIRIVPLLSYHTRWSMLSLTDFQKGGHVIQRYNRGYWLRTTCSLQEIAYTDIRIPSFYLDEDAPADVLNEESLDAFWKIVAFCREHGLHLIVSQCPTPGWSSSNHNAVLQALNGNVVFLDFNFRENLDYVPAVDTFDNGHLNYYGATKYTEWIGDYLIQEGLATDVRGQEKYAFMEEQLREWHENVTIPEPQIDEETLRLYNRRCENARIESYLNVTGGKSDLGTYLNAYWDQDSRVILLTKCGEITGLDAEVRNELDALGLDALSGIGKADNYVGVVDEGKVLTEIKTPRYKPASTEGANYSMTSVNAPEAASIQIGEKEYFGKAPGLTVVVYDKELNTVISQAVFP